MKVEADKTREFYGWIAAILSISSLFNPIKPFIKLMQGKIDLKNSPGFFVTVNYVNNFCWYLYGDLIPSKQIKCINFFGAIFNLILICIYLYYEVKIYTIDAILNTLIIILGSYELYRGITTILEDKEAIGNLCMVTHLLSLLYPLVLIIRVIKKKDYNLIPIYLVWISLSSSMSWIYYGVYLLNINIIYPNIAGFILGIFSIIIYSVYSKKYQGINEFNNIETLGIQSNEKNELEENTNVTIDEDVENKNKKAKPVKIVNSKEDN